MQGARMLRLAALAATLFAIGAPSAYASSAQSDAGLLVIGDSSGNEVNHVSVTNNDPYYRVTDTSPMTPQFGCTAAGSFSVDCDTFGLEQLGAFLHGGNDTFSSAVLLPATVSGGDGSDAIGGGPLNDSLEGNRGNDTIDGYEGNDSLTDGDNLIGADGNDELDGDVGNDHLDGGAIADTGAGADVLNGGPETDTLTYAQRTQPLTITEDGNANDGQTGEHDNVTNVETMILGSAGDHVIADASSNTLKGQGGGDSLNGGAANDQLFGGSGNDILNGSTGADVLSGGANQDTVTYASRTARVVVSIGVGANDGAIGEKDTVLEDVETLIGGAGNDLLTGEDGANTLTGGNGADELAGLGGDDNLNGGKGADTLNGGSGNETLTGGPNGDQISGSSGDDVVNARDGIKDQIDCGTGDDHVTVDAIDVVASNCEHVSLSGRAE